MVLINHLVRVRYEWARLSNLVYLRLDRAYSRFSKRKQEVRGEVGFSFSPIHKHNAMKCTFVATATVKANNNNRVNWRIIIKSKKSINEPEVFLLKFCFPIFWRILIVFFYRTILRYCTTGESTASSSVDKCNVLTKGDFPFYRKKFNAEKYLMKHSGEIHTAGTSLRQRSLV